MTSNNEKKLLTKSDINKVFWRSFTVNASFNYERQMSQGAQYALSPILQKLYPDKKELGEALQRHAEFFNTTPMLCPFIFGITAAMEEENATQEDFDPNTINSVKAGLMGPLAGIGDSVFWGTLRPLAGGIACSLALTGNLFAPFLFLLLFNIPNVLVRYFGCHWGYNSGMKALNRFEELGLTEKIFTAAAIIGLLVIGGMSASMVSVNPVIAIGSGDSAIKLIAWYNEGGDGQMAAGVEPMLVSNSNQLAGVDDVFNAVLMKGDMLGDVVFYGKGAGKLPTASAVVADVIDALKEGVKVHDSLFWKPAEKPEGLLEDRNTYPWYLRVTGVAAALLPSVAGAGHVVFEDNGEAAYLVDAATSADIAAVTEKIEVLGGKVALAMKKLED